MRGSSTSASWREQSPFISFFHLPPIHPPHPFNHTLVFSHATKQQVFAFSRLVIALAPKVFSSAGDLTNKQVMYDLPFPKCSPQWSTLPRGTAKCQLLISLNLDNILHGSLGHAWHAVFINSPSFNAITSRQRDSAPLYHLISASTQSSQHV